FTARSFRDPCGRHLILPSRIGRFIAENLDPKSPEVTDRQLRLIREGRIRCRPQGSLKLLAVKAQDFRLVGRGPQDVGPGLLVDLEPSNVFFPTETSVQRIRSRDHLEAG